MGPLSHCSPPDCFIRVSLFGLSLAVQRIVDREREAHAKALGEAAAGTEGPTSRQAWPALRCESCDQLSNWVYTFL